MKIGSIVELDGQYWKTVGHSRLMKTVHLANFDSKLEVPEEDLKVIAVPSESWPFAQPRVTTNEKSPIVRILRGSTELSPFTEWVPTDFQRQGAIYFNPSLKLRKGEVLTATCLNKTSVRIVIGPTFGTIAKKVAKAVAKNEDSVKTKDSWDDLI